jgi:hypothetical protein
MKVNNFIMIGLISLSFGFCASGGSKASSGESIQVEKKEGFNPSTKKVSTLNVYHLGKKKLGDKSDLIINTLGASIDGKISEIYGEGIVGGDAINTLAFKLKLKNFESSVQNLVESQLNGVSFTDESKKTLSTITEKGKIDALAVPVVTDGFDTLKAGGKVSIFVIIFDGKSSQIQIIGKMEGITAKPEDIALVETKQDQARANMNATLLTKANDLLDVMKKTIKGAPDPTVAKVEPELKSEKSKTVREEAQPESKETSSEPEALSGVDDWLVNKVKVGVGPIVMMFVGLLFIFL